MPRSTRTNKNHPHCLFCGRPLERSRFGKKLIWSHPEPNACPTPERALHGEIAREQRILDDAGRAASPFRSKTNLLLLQSRGIIDEEQLLAGEVFRQRFFYAQLDPLRALDLTQPTSQGARPAIMPSERVMACRDYVWSRLAALGGIDKLPGSCAWNVLGLEKSLQAWTIERALHDRPVGPHEARGILVSVLTVLALNTTAKIWSPPHARSPDATSALRSWAAI
jgi:hypothetical protein